MRVITLPFAGGNRYSLGFLRDLLPENVEYLPLEWPGRGMRMYEPLLTDIHELANDIYNQIQLLDDDNYILLGDCVGALLTFLVTRKLRNENKNLPLRLILSNCPAPIFFKEKSFEEMNEDGMKARLVRFGMDPALLAHKGFFEMIEPIMRADFKAFNEYLYKKEAPLPVPIALLTDQHISKMEVTTRWQEETTYPLITLKLLGSLKNTSTELALLFQEMFANAFVD